jgi:hypothetical protein
MVGVWSEAVGMLVRLASVAVEDVFIFNLLDDGIK